jgi:hypothetical protein
MERKNEDRQRSEPEARDSAEDRRQRGNRDIRLPAYCGGVVGMLLMRLTELLFSFPAILLAVALMASLGTNVLNAMLAIGIIFIQGSPGSRAFQRSPRFSSNM